MKQIHKSTENQIHNYLKHINNWLNTRTKSRLNYRLGFDTGKASLGISIIQDNKHGNPIKILKKFALIMDKDKNPGKRKPKNVIRRNYRHARRTINRSNYRKHRINNLFIKYGLLTHKQEKHYLPLPVNIYKLRYLGLDNKLSNFQIYRVIYYLAKHRGYRQTKTKIDIKGDMTKSLHNTKELLHKHHYRTIGEMLYKSPKFENQKHNRHGRYLYSANRKELVHEVYLILSNQSKYNSKITSSFIHNCINIISSQRPFDLGTGNNSKYAGGILNKVGFDSTDLTSYVNYTYTATFELFQMYQNLANLHIISNGKSHHLSKSQFNKVIKYCKNSNKNTVTFNNILKLLKVSKLNFRSNAVFFNRDAMYHINKCLPKSKQSNITTINEIGIILSLFKSPNITVKYLKQPELLNKLDFKPLNLSSNTIKKLITLSSKDIKTKPCNFSLKISNS